MPVLLAALGRPAVRALLPLLLVLLVGCVFSGEGAFFAWATHRAVLREIAVHGILACGMTAVIIAGGIDLSVGSVLALGAVSFALATFRFGWPAPAAIGAVLALGLFFGAISGWLSARFGIQPFVVTLAAMVFARGLAKLLAGGEKVTSGGAGLPAIFRALDDNVLGGQVAVVALVFAACALVTWLALSRLLVGRWWYAIGDNSQAALLSGVPVRAALVCAYALSGLFAALAGICQAAQETHGDPETGLGYELDAIAMVVLGGTALSGGKGGVGLTVIGALCLGYLQKILSLNAYSAEARLMLTGMILLLAVLFQRAGALQSAPAARTANPSEKEAQR